MYRKTVLAGTLFTGLLAAANGVPVGVGGVTAPGSAEVRTLSETIPAGGTVQVKYLLTQPRPISTGGPRMSTFDFLVNGVGISSPLGDTAGVGLVKNGFLTVAIISPAGDYGTNLDYPFLTVAMTIPKSTPKGSTFPLDFADAVFQTPTGTSLTLTDPKPGVLTVGGSISVHGLVPGGGAWPAGTVIKVEGTGFQPGTKLTTKMRTTNAVFVSPTEMRFTLIQGDVLDMQPVTAQNPDGSKATYFSYLRGVLVQAPSRALLRDAEPVFQTQTHGFATVGPLPAASSTQFVALAIQNPTPGPVVVSFHHNQSGATTSVTLPSCGRIVEDMAKLLGMNLSAGDTVTVSSTAAVQILGINGDEAAVTLTPFLPAF